MTSIMEGTAVLPTPTTVESLMRASPASTMSTPLGRYHLYDNDKTICKAPKFFCNLAVTLNQTVGRLKEMVVKDG